jgi:hypothetical protein
MDMEMRAMTPEPTARNFFAEHSAVTTPGRHARIFRELPHQVGELVDLIQRLVVYDVVAPEFYGFTVPEKRRDEIHMRRVEQILDGILALDDRPLASARPIERRLAGRCHTFTLLLLAMLREKKIPARARCGFGSYFNPPNFEDHWVCEYWNAAEARWVLVDTQFDETWRTQLHIAHDVLDVPRDRFLVAGEAWTQCRTARADPSRFGIEFAHLRGLWFVAGSLVRDVAALNKKEMRPWDVWGAQPSPNHELAPEELRFFDGLSELTRHPDASFGELRGLFQSDERLAVPETVFNALLNRPEPS